MVLISARSIVGFWRLAIALVESMADVLISCSIFAPTSIASISFVVAWVSAGLLIQATVLAALLVCAFTLIESRNAVLRCIRIRIHVVFGGLLLGVDLALVVQRLEDLTGRQPVLALVRLWLLLVGFVLSLELLKEFPTSLVALLVVPRTIGINTITSAPIFLLLLCSS